MDTTLFFHMQEAAMLLHSWQAYGQKKTIKKFFYSIKKHFDRETKIKKYPLKIKSIFFDHEKGIFFIYSIWQEATLIPVKIWHDGGLRIQTAGLMPAYIETWILLILRQWLVSSLPGYRQNWK